MDEGLTLKMCASILHATIAEATDLYKMNTTSVSHTYLILCVINVSMCAFMSHLMSHLMFHVMLDLMLHLLLHLLFHLMLHLLFHLMLHLMLHLMFQLMFQFIGHIINHLKVHCLCNKMWFTLSFLMTKVCREVDDFVLDLASKMPSNKNVQLGGRDGFKFCFNMG
jgi:hypothetical protein